MMREYVKPTILVVKLNMDMQIMAGSGANSVNGVYEEDLEQLSKRGGSSIWDEEDF